MASTLTTSAVMMCPHGGSVSASSSNSTTKAGGSAILRVSDTFTISGCAFTLPGPKLSPCVRVQWIVPDVRTRVGGQPTLSKTSTGLCLSADSIPQGPVSVSTTQTVVAST